MRLVSFRREGREGWGALGTDGSIATPNGVDAPRSLIDLLGAPDRDRWLGHLGAGTEGVPVESVELLAPLPRPVELIAIGVNYREHLVETQGATGVEDRPATPVVFSKASSSVIGPGAAIRIDPRWSSSVDWEVELAAVIGEACTNVRAGAALSHVFGYTIAIDVSARDVQFDAGGGQWYLGKSFDTFCPLGPWIVTADEFGDPGDREISLRLNGTRKQHARTSDLIFGVAELVAAISRGRTLLPGTIVLTGTPGGVGFTRQPPEFLRPGDTVEAEIEGIGVLTNHVRALTDRAPG